MAGQVHRCVGHRDRVLTNCGVGPDFFGDSKRFRKQALQSTTYGASFLRYRKSRLQLTKNLWLTEHHGIQSGRHPHQMCHGLFAVMPVGTGCQRLSVEAVIVADPGDQGIAGGQWVTRHRRHTVDFGPVTGGENHHLVQGHGGQGLTQGGGDVFRGKRHLLSDFESCGVVVDTHRNQVR